MDLTALKTFMAVAETASVTRAADALCCVPSAVTTRLRQLEEELSQRLFIRERQGMMLTPRGRVLLSYAERAVALFDEAEKAVRQDTVPEGLLKIGTTDTAAAIYLPRTVSKYHLAYPNVELKLVSDVSENLLGEVKAHRLDCAIISCIVNDPMFRSDRVRRERLVLVSALRFEDPALLDKFTFLTPRAGGSQRARIEDWLASSSRPPLRFVEMPNLEMRLSCVAAGMGVSILPLATLSQFADRGTVRYHDIPEPWCWLDTYFVSRADSPPFAARRRLRELILGEFSESGAMREDIEVEPCSPDESNDPVQLVDR